MAGDSSVKKVLFGGDYNPEQWSEEDRKLDMELLPKAGVDVVTLNVFSWAALQPSEDEYNFSDLDRIVDMVSAKGMKICMATSTAAHPAWMARKYPDICKTDIYGRRHVFGARQNSCPSSPTFRKYAPRLARKLAERYGERENIVAWHVSNEYGGFCWCANCAASFRVWLKRRYGSLSALNRAWNSAFWGHTYYSFGEIEPPSYLGEMWPENKTACQIQTIDWYRFQSDNFLECYKLERDALKKVTPHIPVTTNLMGAFPELNYHDWGREMDFISWDNYPSPSDPWTMTAMNHELMRGCKIDRPFCLMEQTPSVTNWQPYNSLKRPGVMRLLSYQALAHGSDTVMFFQLRRSRGGCEKFHGAVIDHYPTEDTRVFREVAALGKELNELGGEFLSGTEDSSAAILFDWNCMWGLMFTAGPSADFKYTREIHKYYGAFARRNIPVDIIGPDGDLSKYQVVAAPALYMTDDGLARRLEEFTASGGTLITTVMSGITDENDLVVQNGYPGKLRKLCGLRVEETDALLPGQTNRLVAESGAFKGEYPAALLCDIIRPEGAEVLAVYGDDFYAGLPALTRNTFGSGDVYYVGAGIPDGDTSLAERLVDVVCAEHGIAPVIAAGRDIEATMRVTADGRKFAFILNHGTEEQEITLPFAGTELLTRREFAENQRVPLKGRDVMIVRLS